MQFEFDFCFTAEFILILSQPIFFFAQFVPKQRFTQVIFISHLSKHILCYIWPLNWNTATVLYVPPNQGAFYSKQVITNNCEWD